MLLMFLIDLLENTTRFYFCIIIGQNHVSMLLRAAPIARFAAFLMDEFGGSHCIQHYIETGEVRSMRLSPFDGTQAKLSGEAEAGETANKAGEAANKFFPVFPEARARS